MNSQLRTTSRRRIERAAGYRKLLLLLGGVFMGLAIGIVRHQPYSATCLVLGSGTIVVYLAMEAAASREEFQTSLKRRFQRDLHERRLELHMAGYEALSMRKHNAGRSNSSEAYAEQADGFSAAR